MRVSAAIAIVLLAASAPGTADAQEPPRPKPMPEATVPPDPVEPGREEPAESSGDRAAEEVDEAALAACERELRAHGVEFERRDPIEGEGSCGVAAPYNIRRIAPGVALRPDTELRCQAALAAARWIANVVVPAARALAEGVRLSGVTHASTYVCRHRNNIATAKVSEHAAGAAIDINGFDLEGYGPVPVVPRAGNGTIEEAFQRAVRAGACLHFTTVLGPGSDGFHDDHLHLDLARRRGGYRLCE